MTDEIRIESLYPEGSEPYEAAIERQIAVLKTTYLDEDEKKAEPKIRLSEAARLFDMNERGDAEIYSRLMERRFIFDVDHGTWLFWNGICWEQDKFGHYLAATNAVANFFNQAAADLFAQLQDAPDEEARRIQRRMNDYLKRARKIRTNSRRKNIVEVARSDFASVFAVRSRALDTHPWKLAVANGILDFEQGLFFSRGEPQDLITRRVSTEWQGLEASCPTWERFLLDVLDEDVKLVRFVQKILGYMITGITSEKTFPVFYGPTGENGKTLLTETLLSVLGSDIADVVPVSLLLARRGAENPNAPTPILQRISGLRLAITREPQANQYFDDGMVKALTGGDRLPVRGMYDPSLTSKEPQHHILLHTNRIPRAESDDHALWRRLLIIPFRVSFYPDTPEFKEKREKVIRAGGKVKPAVDGLRERLRREAPGILRWLVEGALLWKKEGLSPIPQVVQDVTRAERLEQDFLADFLEKYTEEVPEAREGASDLYAVFLHWWEKEQRARRKISQAAFSKKMKNRFGPSRKESGGRKYFHGIQLNQAGRNILNLMDMED